MNDLTYKLCIFGDGGVGKTTLINRYMTGVFNPEARITIGVNFYIKKLIINNQTVSLQIWDFAGEERFREFMPGYLRGATGGIFMYDITRYQSLESVSSWINVLKNTENPDISMLMVGGKLDLENNRAFSKKEAEIFAKENNFQALIECSSKTGENVEELFLIITKFMIEKAESYVVS